MTHQSPRGRRLGAGAQAPDRDARPRDRTSKWSARRSDPYAAREKIKQLNPDVITLDIEMPRMDGLTFLENLMRLRPMPVVMVSSLTQRGADVTLRALELGAIDFVAKPSIDIAGTLDDYERRADREGQGRRRRACQCRA